MGSIDLVGTDPPSWLYLRRSREFGTWGCHGQIGLRVHSRARVLVLRGGRSVGCFPMSRMMAGAGLGMGLGLGNSPLLSRF